MFGLDPLVLLKMKKSNISSVIDWTVTCFHRGVRNNRFYEFYDLKVILFNWIQKKQLREISGTTESNRPRIITKKLMQKAKLFN